MWRALAAIGVWEGFWWARRCYLRSAVYAQALAQARCLKRPLVVIGAPDRGATGGYPCGDVTIDIQSSTCPVSIQADITKPLPFADNSVVVFVSYVLEYVSDYNAALAELQRISGGQLYVVRVEPWSLTAYFYPGAKRTVQPRAPAVERSCNL